MKITTKATLLGFPLSAILIWTAAAQQDPGSQDTDAEAAVAQAETAARMDLKKDNIAARVGMSAPLELPEPGERDVVAEALADGRIIEVTLEEVEAALNAAKLTPQVEDDVEAMNLAHWGSYRFFLDEKPSGEAVETTR